MTAPTAPRPCYVAIDLINHKVVSIAAFADLADSRGYVIEGTHGEDGEIILSTDDRSWNGREARRIALDPTQQGVGLGWRFTTDTPETDDDELLAVEMTADDLTSVADALQMLAEVDEGEHTDYADLVRLYTIFRDRLNHG